MLDVSLYKMTPARRVYTRYVCPCRTVSPELFRQASLKSSPREGGGRLGFGRRRLQINRDNFGAEVLAARAQIPSICQAKAILFPVGALFGINAQTQRPGRKVIELRTPYDWIFF